MFVAREDTRQDTRHHLAGDQALCGQLRGYLLHTKVTWQNTKLRLHVIVCGCRGRLMGPSTTL